MYGLPPTRTYTWANLRLKQMHRLVGFFDGSRSRMTLPLPVKLSCLRCAWTKGVESDRYWAPNTWRDIPIGERNSLKLSARAIEWIWGMSWDHRIAGQWGR